MKKTTLILNYLFFCIFCFAQPSTSSVRPTDKVILLNGKPFFPVGIYHVSAFTTTQELINHTQQIAALGCNTMHATYRPTLDFTLFLNTAQSLNIYVIVEGMFDNANVEAIINQYKTHPALLGWTIADDADVVFQQPSNISDPGLLLARQEFVDRNNFLKNLDPNHITYSTVSNFNIWNNFFDITDVTSPYTYPIPEGRTRLLRTTRLGEVYSNIFVANTSIPNTRCFFGITQMNNEPNLDLLINPTPVEYRNMVYQYIMSNVKGIISYTFIDGFNFLPNYSGLQSEFSAVNAEINSLSQILLNGTFQRITTFNSSTNVEYYPDFDGIQASTWHNSASGDTFVIIANTKSQENLLVNIQMPSTTSGIFTNLFAGRPSGLVYNSDTKVLSGNINAADVHVYKFNSQNSFENDLNIYPNPAQDFISFKINGLDDSLSEINFYNTLGQKIRVEVGRSNIVSGYYSCDISELKKGIYIINILNNEKEKQVGKLIKN